MTLKARKDFMVFKQRDLLWSGLIYCSWSLYVRSKSHNSSWFEAMFTTTEENEVAFVILGFSRKTNFAYK